MIVIVDGEQICQKAVRIDSESRSEACACFNPLTKSLTRFELATLSHQEWAFPDWNLQNWKLKVEHWNLKIPSL